METQIVSRSAKELDKAAYSHNIFLNLYAECITREAGIEKDDRGFKIGKGNITIFDMLRTC